MLQVLTCAANLPGGRTCRTVGERSVTPDVGLGGGETDVMDSGISVKRGNSCRVRLAVPVGSLPESDPVVRG